MAPKENQSNKPVIGAGPVIGHHYLAVLAKLKMGVGPFLNFLGANRRDHDRIIQNPDAIIRDEGLALHFRLLDRHPELLRSEPTVDELVQEIKAIRRERPDLQLPMRVTPPASWACCWAATCAPRRCGTPKNPSRAEKSRP